MITVKIISEGITTLHEYGRYPETYLMQQNDEWAEISEVLERCRCNPVNNFEYERIG